jgi:hypothetical protein
MNHLEGTRTVVGSAVATNSSTTALLRLDTLGYDYASIDVLYGATLAGGTNSSVAQVLTLQHSDAATSGYAAITGYTVAAPAFSANTASSTSMSVIRLDVDMRGKRRYLEVASSPNTLATVTVVARLGKGEEHPTAAAGKGVAIAFRG